jgi:hypothetical protein
MLQLTGLQEESREVLGVKTSGLLGKPLHLLMAEVEELKSLEKAVQLVSATKSLHKAYCEY